jgi:hypothetical protein
VDDFARGVTDLGYQFIPISWSFRHLMTIRLPIQDAVCGHFTGWNLTNMIRGVVLRVFISSLAISRVLTFSLS